MSFANNREIGGVLRDRNLALSMVGVISATIAIILAFMAVQVEQAYAHTAKDVLAAGNVGTQAADLPIGDGLDELTGSLDFSDGVSWFLDCDENFEGACLVDEGGSLTPTFRVTYWSGGSSVTQKELDPSKYTITIQTQDANWEWVDVVPPLQAGAYKVIATANEGSGLSGTQRTWLSVSSRSDLSGARVSLPESHYDKSLHQYVYEPGEDVEFTVENDLKVLPASAYEVKYYENIETDERYSLVPTLPGKYLFVIEGKSPYYGQNSASFSIMASIEKATVSGLVKRTYNGKAQTQPKLVVKYGSKALKIDEDYSLTYQANKNAGTAKVTITGKGFYTKSKVVEFKIARAANTVKLRNKSASVKAKDLKKKFTGVAIAKAAKAKGAVTYSITKVTKAKLKKNFSINKKSGKIAIKKGTPKGTYRVTVKAAAKGTANYKSGSATAVVTIRVK